MSVKLVLPLVLALGMTAPAIAGPKDGVAREAGLELSVTHRCSSCHTLDKKAVGPTWKTIAEQNKNRKDAEKLLAEAIVKGSKGRYGAVPMPPQPKAAKDSEALAKWILSLN